MKNVQNIPVRFDKHDGLDGSILGSSIDNNEPWKFGNIYKP